MNHNTGIVIGFDQVMYNVSESITVIQVCVSILDGSLADNRNVTVILQSLDGTATGDLIERW